MKITTKAALLSGLIFPGVGQLTQGKKSKGWGFIISALVILALMIAEIVSKAKEVIQGMQQQGITITPEAVSKATTEVSQFSDHTYLNILLLSFIALWLISIIDAFKGAKQ